MISKKYLRLMIPKIFADGQDFVSPDDLEEVSENHLSDEAGSDDLESEPDIEEHSPHFEAVEEFYLNLRLTWCNASCRFNPKSKNNNYHYFAG